jgi:hypothetical protein
VSTSHDDLDELFSDPSVVVGVWANSTFVHRQRSEFTIDFIRRVPDPPGSSSWLARSSHRMSRLICVINWTRRGAAILSRRCPRVNDDR